ncbi:MAG TPA: ABC transporter permease [Terriglobales bacterium]|jgi:ABC-2 type transport system permease protein|nr:ABC transporter permease [Terriglobales bacterium]
MNNSANTANVNVATLDSGTWAPGTPTRTVKQTLRIYFTEAKSEFLIRLRLPGYVIPTILFPLIFYSLFGLTHSQAALARTTVGAYLLATFGSFGVIAISLFGFGVSVAVERGQGWMMVKRASPMPRFAYFAAKIAMAMLFSLVMLLLLFTLGIAAGHARMPFTAWAGLSGTLLLGVLPFAAMGLAIGYLAGPNSAAPVCNLIYLPMSFASGLWTPIEFLPKAVQHIAPFLPFYHLGQLALDRIRGGFTTADWVHIAALTGFTIFFLALAAIGYRRDEGKTYG